jgi:outer membrane protein assembly factor BamB
MNCHLLIFFSLLFSLSVNGFSQTLEKTFNSDVQKKSFQHIIDPKQIGIKPLIDTSFVFEARSKYSANYDSLNFEPEDEAVSGIYTFRGSNQRNSPVRGTLSDRPSVILKDWIFTTDVDTTNGLYGTWGGGAGWTGQPLYVEWSKEEMNDLDGLYQEFKNRKSILKEIIQVSLCGKIYFIDLETGKPTRKPLTIDNPIKGTPSIDGSNKRFLLVGQGIQNKGNFAWRIFDLRKQTLLHVETMPSSFANRLWGASDASPLVDHRSGAFVWPTESGIIYRSRLYSQKIPAPEQYRFLFIEHKKQGTESSPAAYKYLGYISDNAGNVFCIDMRTMKPRWHFFNTDDTDASPVIEIENDTPYVYVGNEIDLQGARGKSYLRKLDGLTGEIEWEYERECYNVTSPKVDNGGILSTPLPGRKKTQSFIWTIFSRVDPYGRGALVCLNTSDGKVKYEVPLNFYSWVSPIALYDTDGNTYVYFSDVGGNIYLLNGVTGEVIFKEKTDNIFEASPIAIGNRIIQPARGNRIYCYLLK